MKLTAGNSDLYHNYDANLGVHVAALGDTTVESHKYDLVFLYKWDSYAVDVKPFVEANADSWASAIESIDGKAIDTWLGDADGQVNVEEVVVDGQLYNTGYTKSGTTYTAVTHDGEHIEPIHSNNSSDYFVVGLDGGVKRGTEYYQIRYTVTDGENTYVAHRTVKLRYRIGDTDLDGAFSVADASYTLAYLNGTYQPFLDETGAIVNELVMQVMNDDGDNSLTVADYSALLNYLNLSTPLASCRI